MCIYKRKNFRLADIPSLTVAITWRPQFISKIATARQKMGNNWYETTVWVRKYANINLRVVWTPLTMNANTWDATSSSSKVEKSKSGSPSDVKPINLPECLSNTSFPLIFISSKTSTFHLQLPQSWLPSILIRRGEWLLHKSFQTLEKRVNKKIKEY